MRGIKRDSPRDLKARVDAAHTNIARIKVDLAEHAERAGEACAAEYSLIHTLTQKLEETKRA